MEIDVNLVEILGAKADLAALRGEKVAVTAGELKELTRYANELECLRTRYNAVCGAMQELVNEYDE